MGVQGMQTTAVVKGVTAEDLKAIMGKLDVIFQRIREAWKDAAGLLSRLSGPQMDEVKRRFRGIVTADHLERLAMMGKGELAPHLALPEKIGLPASFLRRLPESTLEVLNNPNREAEVWRPDGKVFTRRIGQMSQMELAQVVGKRGEVLKADAQRRRYLSMARQPVENLKADALIFDGLTLGENGEAVMYWRHDEDDPGSKRYSGTVALKTLREILR